MKNNYNNKRLTPVRAQLSEILQEAWHKNTSENKEVVDQLLLWQRYRALFNE